MFGFLVDLIDSALEPIVGGVYEEYNYSQQEEEEEEEDEVDYAVAPQCTKEEYEYLLIVECERLYDTGMSFDEVIREMVILFPDHKDLILSLTNGEEEEAGPIVDEIFVIDGDLLEPIPQALLTPASEAIGEVIDCEVIEEESQYQIFHNMFDKSIREGYSELEAICHILQNTKDGTKFIHFRLIEEYAWMTHQFGQSEVESYVDLVNIAPEHESFIEWMVQLTPPFVVAI